MNTQMLKCAFPRILSASCAGLAAYHAFTAYVMGVSSVEAVAFLEQMDKAVDRRYPAEKKPTLKGEHHESN